MNGKTEWRRLWKIKLLLKLNTLSGVPVMKVSPSLPICLNGYKASAVDVRFVKHQLKIMPMPLETAFSCQYLDKMIPAHNQDLVGVFFNLDEH